MLHSKACSDCGAAKPLTEFHKRAKSPDGLAYRCRDCVKQALVAWRAKNPDAFNVWATDNAEHRAEYRRAWYARNRDKQPERYAKWRRQNPDNCAARRARRRAAIKHATPPWANPAAIRALYAESARITKATGIRHEVDHIYPLQGKFVCGLHHEANLQILTRSENARKRNKMPSVAT